VQFSVTRLRIRGVRLPERAWSRQPCVTGDLRTFRIKDALTGEYVERAVVSSPGSQAPLLPELTDFRLVAAAPLALLLRGFERVDTARGPIDYVQEWWIRKPEEIFEWRPTAPR
jgi:hypothetical protein